MSVAAHARSGESTAHALMDRWYAAWNAHDVAAVTACLTDDARLEEPDAPPDGYQGPEAIASWMQAWLIACPDLLLTEHERWVTPGGSVIATWFTMRATFTGPLEPPGFAPTNTVIELQGMDRTEVRDGLVARHQIFFDTTTIARKIGAAPEPGSFGERVAVRLQRMAARKLRRRRGCPD